MWPAELASQYKFVYSAPQKVESLVALAERPGWEVKANFHLGYWLAAAAKRWYPARHLDGPTYMRQWIKDYHDRRAGRRRRPPIALKVKSAERQAHPPIVEPAPSLQPSAGRDSC